MRAWIFIVCMSFGAAHAGAEPLQLTEAEAIKLAGRRAPLVLIESAKTREAAAEIDRAEQFENPSVRVSSVRPADLEEEKDFRVAVRVPVPNPFVRSPTVRQAEALHRAQRGFEQKSAQDAQARVRELYAEWWYLGERRIAVEQALAEDTAFASWQGERVIAGAATALDQQLAQIGVMRLESDQQSIDSQKETIRAEILYWTGVPEDAQIVGGAPPVPGGPYVADADALIKRATRSRPDLRSQDDLLVGAAAEESRERAKRWPWFSWLQLGYDVETGNDTSPYGISLALDIPILSWNTGGVRRAEARHAAQVQTKRELSQAVARDVRTEADRVRRKTERVLRAQKLLTATETAKTAAAEALSLGALDPGGARAITLEHRRALEEYQQSLYELQLARINLDLAVGGQPAR